MDAHDGVTLAASDDAEIDSAAAGGAGSGSVAVGAAISTNYIGGDPGNPSRQVDPDPASTNAGQVRASIAGSTVDSGTGNVSLIADSKPRIINATVGGAGAGDVAVSGSISINFIRSIVEAAITGGSIVTAGDSVNLSATTTPIMIIVAGNGGGAGTVAASVSSASNGTRSDVKARIEASTVTATSGDVIANAEVQRANTLPDMDARPPSTYATDSSSQSVSVEKGQTVNLLAGFVGSPAMGDVGAQYKYISDTTRTIDLSTENYTNAAYWEEVDTLDAQIWSFAVSGNGAGEVSVVGSLSLNWIRNTVDAHISGGSAVIVNSANSGTVTVSAADHATLNALAGSGTGSGGVAVSGSAACNYLGGDPEPLRGGKLSGDPTSPTCKDQPTPSRESGDPAPGSSATASVIQAYIDDSTVTARSVAIDAYSNSAINNVCSAGAGSQYVAIGASTVINRIRVVVDAHISNDSTGTALFMNRAIDVAAHNDSTIRSISAGGGGAIVGGGMGFTYNEIFDTVQAYADGLTLSATAGDIALEANPAGTIQGVTAGVAGGAVGVAGSIDINRLRDTTEAYITDSTATADRSLTVLADNNGTMKAYCGTNIDSSGGVLGLSGTSIRATVDADILTNTTKAYITDTDTASRAQIYGRSGFEVNALTREKVQTISVGIAVGSYAALAGAASGAKIATTSEAFVCEVDVTAGTVPFTGTPGGSVAVVTIGSTAIAYVDNNATLFANSATGDVRIESEFTDTATAKAAGGGAGLVGLGAQVAIVNDNSSQRAYSRIADDGTPAANGAKIVKANSLIVSATADRTLDAEAKGAAGGALAVGAAVGRAAAGGSTLAYLGDYTQVGQSTDHVGSVSITADSTANVDADVLAVAAGIVSGAGGDAKALSSPTIQAGIGDHSAVHVRNSVTTTSLSAADTLAKSVGGGGGGGVTVGVALSEATDSPAITTFIGDAATVVAGQDVTVRTLHNYDLSGNLIANVAKAYAMGPVGALIGGAGTDCTATASPTIDTYVGAGASVLANGAPGTVSVTSVANNEPALESLVYIGGAISAGAATGDAQAEGSNTARIGASTSGASGATVSADAVLVSAYTNDYAHTYTQTGAGGILAGSGSIASAEANSTTQAFVGRSSHVAGTDSVDVLATGQPRAEATADGINAGGLTVGVSKGTAEASPTISAYVADGAVAAPTVVTVGRTVTGNITFDHTGRMTTTGDVTFTHDGNLSGTPNLTFADNGSFDQTGQVTFAANGTISGPPALHFDNNASTTFRNSLTFARAVSLQGAPNLTFTPTGAFAGTSSITITIAPVGTSGGTVTRAGGGSWISDGFVVGQSIYLSGTPGGLNNMDATVKSVTATVLELEDTPGAMTDQTITDSSSVTVQA